MQIPVTTTPVLVVVNFSLPLKNKSTCAPVTALNDLGDAAGPLPTPKVEPLSTPIQVPPVSLSM